MSVYSLAHEFCRPYKLGKYDEMETEHTLFETFFLSIGLLYSAYGHLQLLDILTGVFFYFIICLSGYHIFDGYWREHNRAYTAKKVTKARAITHDPGSDHEVRMTNMDAIRVANLDANGDGVVDGEFNIGCRYPTAPLPHRLTASPVHLLTASPSGRVHQRHGSPRIGHR